MKKNVARSFSNRRAISQERMFPIVQCTQYKRQMKMILSYQGLESTRYQVKKQRYIQNQTALPVFQEQTRTDIVQVSQSGLQVNTLSSVLSRSSFKDLYERVSQQCSSTVLTQAPQSALEWMYATGGIIPYGR